MPLQLFSEIFRFVQHHTGFVDPYIVKTHMPCRERWICTPHFPGGLPFRLAARRVWPHNCLVNGNTLNLSRRAFIKTSTTGVVGAALGAAFGATGGGVAQQNKMIGIQAGAISFVDEGTDRVLDILQERGGVNTIFLATFTYGRGIAGRQVPNQPLPDHGKKEYDLDFHGGNYATPHSKFYENTSLKETKAPDHGALDILAEVLPKAHSRGMKVYCWYEDVFRTDIPGIEKLQELDWQGRRAGTLCPLHPDYRNFLTGLTADYCQSYEIDGLMWGSERQGPLHNAIGARHGGKADPSRVTCFCELHRQAAKERGIDVKRAKQGFEKLDQFLRPARANERPTDGYFVQFWRLLLEYPELLAWEKLWTDSKHAIYADIYQTAKQSRAGVQVGFHIWHANSFSPFFRAEQDYAELARTADFLKVVVYNNCGGPRYAEYIKNVSSTIFGDVPREELVRLHHEWLDYPSEPPLEGLATMGLSSDYVYRETRRALTGVSRVAGRKCSIYPGIDVDIPTGADEKKTSPEDVHAATAAALKAGADGVIFSRKYSEMKLANLAAGGRAVREFGAERK